MKGKYMDDQLLLRTEQEEDFLRKMDWIDMRLVSAIQSGNQKELEKIIAELEQDGFLYYVSGDLEISKMYFAAYYSALVDRVKAAGLPGSPAISVKKSAFQMLAAAKSEQDIRALSMQLFQQLFSLYQRYTMHSYSLPVQRAVEMIHAMQMQPLSAGTVARVVGMERTYLAKLFHQETGRTMTDYIHSVKIDLAETLILARHYTLREIADLLGYESYAHFSRTFKKHTGVLPSQWLHTEGASSPADPQCGRVESRARSESDGRKDRNKIITIE